MMGRTRVSSAISIALQQEVARHHTGPGVRAVQERDIVAKLRLEDSYEAVTRRDNSSLVVSVLVQDEQRCGACFACCGCCGDVFDFLCSATLASVTRVSRLTGLSPCTMAQPHECLPILAGLFYCRTP